MESAPVVPHKPPPKVAVRPKKTKDESKVAQLRLSAKFAAPPPPIAGVGFALSPIPPKIPPPNALPKPPQNIPKIPPPRLIPPKVPDTNNPSSEVEEEEEEQESPTRPEPSKEEKKKAAITIQTAFRYSKQRKAYKELYEKRKWTLHKEAKVLTNHVTKSRVSGRPGRRPPTRGKRVVGLAKPTYEDKPKVIPEEVPNVPGSSPLPKFPGGGPTRAVSSKPRPMTSLGCGLNFDPSKVKLKASPTPARKKETAGSAPVSPIFAMRKNLRPTTTINASPIKPLEPNTQFTKPSTSTKSAPTTPPNVPPSKPEPVPRNTPPPKPSQLKDNLGIKAQLASMPIVFSGGPISPISPTSPTSGDDLQKAESLPTIMLSPRSGAPMQTNLSSKRKKRTNKLLSSFLTRRPRKEDLINDGILKREEEAFPELGKEFHSQNEIPEKVQPALRIGKTCMVTGCDKKVKGKKVHCYRCGKVICKSHMHKKKEFMPEFKYNSAMSICTLCFHERRKEIIAHKAEYLKNIADNIK